MHHKESQLLWKWGQMMKKNPPTAHHKVTSPNCRHPKTQVDEPETEQQQTKQCNPPNRSSESNPDPKTRRSNHHPTNNSTKTPEETNCCKTTKQKETKTNAKTTVHFSSLTASSTWHPPQSCAPQLQSLCNVYQRSLALSQTTNLRLHHKTNLEIYLPKTVVPDNLAQATIFV